MIKRIASVTAKWLLHAGAISASDVELYEYGIYSFLFSMCPLGLVLIISFFLGMVKEGVLLIIPFILIRKFCGGFHFQSSALCGIVSTAVLTVFVIGVRAVTIWNGYLWWGLAMLLSVIQITAFSPIDSEGRRLTPKEKQVFRKIAVVLAIVTSLLAAVLLAFRQQWAAVSLGMGVILTAALQFPCVVIILTQKCNERKSQK